MNTSADVMWWNFGNSEVTLTLILFEWNRGWQLINFCSLQLKNGKFSYWWRYTSCWIRVALQLYLELPHLTVRCACRYLPLVYNSGGSKVCQRWQLRKYMLLAMITLCIWIYKQAVILVLGYVIYLANGTYTSHENPCRLMSMLI